MRKLILFFLVLYFANRFSLTPVLAVSTALDKTAKVEYSLPYPGVLPDNPLYILKIFRDRIVEAFLTDQKQLAFYELFLSDKRLAAGQALVNNNKADLGAATILQAQDYYHKATDLAVKLQNNDLRDKIIVAGSKHEEVITDLQPKVSGAASTKLGTALLADQKDKNRVLELMMKK